jgi:glyoxylate reductase
VDRVYVTRELPERLIDPLRQVTDVVMWGGDGPVPNDVLVSETSTADGLLCMITDAIGPSLLARASYLRVISQMAVGVDNIDTDECSRRGILVGHTPGVLTETVADSAFALLGAAARRLFEGEREVRSGKWGPWEPFHLTGGDLHNTTLGIVGMGRIGSAIARRAAGYEMRVLYSSPTSKDLPDADHVSLKVLLGESDHVVLSASLNVATRGLIGAPELRLMRPTAYLVNVARGPLVDTADLTEALLSGQIAGAALDVTDPEPLPPDHPLLSLPNCLVVPHIGSASVRTRNAMAALAVENLIAGLEGWSMPAGFSTAG